MIKTSSMNRSSNVLNSLMSLSGAWNQVVPTTDQREETTEYLMTPVDFSSSINTKLEDKDNFANNPLTTRWMNSNEKLNNWSNPTELDEPKLSNPNFFVN